MRLTVFLSLLLGWSAACAQALEKICLPEDDAGTGLSVAVDGRGRIHLSRVFRILGGLNHTVVGQDGVGANEELARFVSLLAIDEVTTTDLLLQDDQPRICFYNAGLRGFEVAVFENGAWQREVVAMGQGVGRWCNLLEQAGRLVVVFGGDDGVVRLGRRQRADDWQVEEVDAVAGLEVGLDGSATLINGRIVAAHRTAEDRLRISWQQAQGFLHEEVLDLGLGAGVDPVAVASDGQDLWVVHGFVSRPGTSDGGLVLTQGTLGALRSGLVDQAEMGGANGAVRIGNRLEVVTRYYRRNALFGSADGLRRYTDLTRVFGFSSLEEHGSAAQRHTWNNVDITSDPFGLPVIAVQDEAEPFINDRGSARVCIWRPRDTDNDRLPDDAEADYGAMPNNPDTDGDGRLDGDEVLDGRNPAGEDPLDPPDVGSPGPPDQGPPDEEDAAAAPSPDGGLADAEPQADVRSEETPDDGLEDLGPIVDGRIDPPTDAQPIVDGALPAPDATPLDADLIDVSISPDARVVTADRGVPSADAVLDGSLPEPTPAANDDGCAQSGGSPAPWPLVLLFALLGRGRRERTH